MEQFQCPYPCDTVFSYWSAIGTLDNVPVQRTISPTYRNDEGVCITPEGPSQFNCCHGSISSLIIIAEQPIDTIGKVLQQTVSVIRETGGKNRFEGMQIALRNIKSTKYREPAQTHINDVLALLSV